MHLKIFVEDIDDDEEEEGEEGGSRREETKIGKDDERSRGKSGRGSRAGRGEGGGLYTATDSLSTLVARRVIQYNKTEQYDCTSLWIYNILSYWLRQPVIGWWI